MKGGSYSLLVLVFLASRHDDFEFVSHAILKKFISISNHSTEKHASESKRGSSGNIVLLELRKPQQDLVLYFPECQLHYFKSDFRVFENVTRSTRFGLFSKGNRKHQYLNKERE